MRVYKDKQFLVFEIERGVVKYDFSQKQAIGLKGMPVKDLKSQLRGITMRDIRENCEDQNYAAFLKRIELIYPTYISNIGTILSCVPQYAWLEQMYAAGIGDKIDSRLLVPITEIPRALLKLLHTRNFTLTRTLLNVWKANPDACNCLCNEEYLSLTDTDIQNILIHNDSTRTCNIYFFDTVEKYGYTPKSLMHYIDRIKTYEAVEDVWFILRELRDYLRMVSSISQKYEKYPRNLLTTIRIASRNYSRLKTAYPEEVFRSRIDKSLEFKYKDYIFVYPDSTQDIKDEAVQQNNCVSSYIEDVIDGKKHVLFLRHKDAPDKSLVTIEVRNNRIVQAKRRFNESISRDELEAVNAWNKRYASGEDYFFIA